MKQKEWTSGRVAYYGSELSLEGRFESDGAVRKEGSLIGKIENDGTIRRSPCFLYPGFFSRNRRCKRVFGGTPLKRSN